MLLLAPPTLPVIEMARSLSDLRKMQRTQLKSVNKDELIEAIITSTDADAGGMVMLQDKLTQIATDLKAVKTSIASSNTVTATKLADMQQKIDNQAGIIMQQQLFLEKLDRREREKNLVLLGVPDVNEALEGATSEEGKIGKVFDVLQVQAPIRSHRRLGRQEQSATRPRPILVTVDTKSERDAIVGNGKKLKESREALKKIFVKKDIHPAVRKEWKRLHDAEAREKDKPENQGCVIRLDFQERKLYKNNIVIDSWNPHPF